MGELPGDVGLDDAEAKVVVAAVVGEMAEFADDAAAGVVAAGAGERPGIVVDGRRVVVIDFFARGDVAEGNEDAVLDDAGV